jgi:SNARE protein 1
VQPENKKPVVEGREEEISDEKAKAVSPISLSSGLQRRSA